MTKSFETTAKAFFTITILCLGFIAGNLVRIARALEANHSKTTVQQTGFQTDIVEVRDRVWVSFEGQGAEGYIVSKPEGGYDFAYINNGDARLPDGCKFIKRVQFASGEFRYEPIRTTEDNL